MSCGGRVSPFDLRYPDPAVVPERLGHERKLGLVFPGHGDAGGMDLGEAGVREQCAFFIGPVGRVHARAEGVGRQEKDVGIAAGAEADRISGMGLDLRRSRDRAQ